MNAAMLGALKPVERVGLDKVPLAEFSRASRVASIYYFLAGLHLLLLRLGTPQPLSQIPNPQSRSANPQSRSGNPESRSVLLSPEQGGHVKRGSEVQILGAIVSGIVIGRRHEAGRALVGRPVSRLPRGGLEPRVS